MNILFLFKKSSSVDLEFEQIKLKKYLERDLHYKIWRVKFIFNRFQIKLMKQSNKKMIKFSSSEKKHELIIPTWIDLFD